MTKEMRLDFQDKLGRGTGLARYRQLRKYAFINGLPLKELLNGKHSISIETIEAFQDLTDDDWETGFILYRRATMGEISRMSADGLEQAKEFIRNFKINATSSEA